MRDFRVQASAQNTPAQPPPLPAQPPPPLDADYEEIELGGAVKATFNIKAGLHMDRMDIRRGDGRHCDLCGCSTPTVRCDKCANQIFCLSCDDMYHRHPKRSTHVRKALDSKMQSVRPPLPPKGEASQPPLPPPRKNKRSGFPTPLLGRKDFATSRLGVFGTPLLGRKEVQSSTTPSLPRKEFSFMEKVGSLKRFMGSKPLPSIPIPGSPKPPPKPNTIPPPVMPKSPSPHSSRKFAPIGILKKPSPSPTFAPAATSSLPRNSSGASLASQQNLDDVMPANTRSIPSVVHDLASPLNTSSAGLDTSKPPGYFSPAPRYNPNGSIASLNESYDGRYPEWEDDGRYGLRQRSSSMAGLMQPSPWNAPGGGYLRGTGIMTGGPSPIPPSGYRPDPFGTLRREAIPRAGMTTNYPPRGGMSTSVWDLPSTTSMPMPMNRNLPYQQAQSMAQLNCQACNMWSPEHWGYHTGHGMPNMYPDGSMKRTPSTLSMPGTDMVGQSMMWGAGPHMGMPHPTHPGMHPMMYASGSQTQLVPPQVGGPAGTFDSRRPTSPALSHRSRRSQKSHRSTRNTSTRQANSSSSFSRPRESTEDSDDGGRSSSASDLSLSPQRSRTGSKDQSQRSIYGKVNIGSNLPANPKLSVNQQWTCEHCTFINDPGQRICAVCCRTGSQFANEPDPAAIKSKGSTPSSDRDIRDKNKLRRARRKTLEKGIRSFSSDKDAPAEDLSVVQSNLTFKITDHGDNTQIHMNQQQVLPRTDSNRHQLSKELIDRDKEGNSGKTSDSEYQDLGKTYEDLNAPNLDRLLIRSPSPALSNHNMGNTSHAKEGRQQTTEPQPNLTAVVGAAAPQPPANSPDAISTISATNTSTPVMKKSPEIQKSSTKPAPREITSMITKLAEKMAKPMPLKPAQAQPAPQDEASPQSSPECPKLKPTPDRKVTQTAKDIPSPKESPELKVIVKSAAKSSQAMTKPTNAKMPSRDTRSPDAAIYSAMLRKIMTAGKESTQMTYEKENVQSVPAATPKSTSPKLPMAILKATATVETATSTANMEDYWDHEKAKMEKSSTYQTFRYAGTEKPKKLLTSKGTSPPPQTISTQTYEEVKVTTTESPPVPESPPDPESPPITAKLKARPSVTLPKTEVPKKFSPKMKRAQSFNSKMRDPLPQEPVYGRLPSRKTRSGSTQSLHVSLSRESSPQPSLSDSRYSSLSSDMDRSLSPEPDFERSKRGRDERYYSRHRYDRAHRDREYNDYGQLRSRGNRVGDYPEYDYRPEREREYRDPFVYKDRDWSYRRSNEPESRRPLLRRQTSSGTEPYSDRDRREKLRFEREDPYGITMKPRHPEVVKPEVKTDARTNYYLSLEDLILRRKQETLKSKGCDLTKLIHEAEELGFTAEDLQVALSHCGDKNPVAWLEDNWHNMIETVVTLATNYGQERTENDIGTLSRSEAGQALRIHKGNVWAAVTECVEHRRLKYVELRNRTKKRYTREDIVTALTACEGNVDAALKELKNSVPEVDTNGNNGPDQQPKSAFAHVSESSLEKLRQFAQLQPMAVAESLEFLDATSEPASPSTSYLEASATRNDPRDSELQESPFEVESAINTVFPEENKPGEPQVGSAETSLDHYSSTVEQPSGTESPELEVPHEDAVLIDDENDRRLPQEEIGMAGFLETEPIKPRTLGTTLADEQEVIEREDESAVQKVEHKQPTEDDQITYEVPIEEQPTMENENFTAEDSFLENETELEDLEQAYESAKYLNDVVEEESSEIAAAPEAEAENDLVEHSEPPKVAKIPPLALLDTEDFGDIEFIDEEEPEINTSESPELEQPTHFIAHVELRQRDPPQLPPLPINEDFGSEEDEEEEEDEDEEDEKEVHVLFPLRLKAPAAKLLSAKLTELMSLERTQQIPVPAGDDRQDDLRLVGNKAFDRKVRRILAEGRASTYEKAELAARLIDLKFEEDESIYAANECSNLYTAISYLQQDCELCACKYPIKEIITMLHCTHHCCKSCAKTYFTTQIKDRSIMDAVCPFCRAPEPDFDDEEITQDYFLHLDILLKGILDREIHELFQRKLRDKTLTKDPNFRWCNKCSSGFIANPKQKRHICPDCRAVTCANCRKPWEKQHEGLTCEHFAEWKESNDPETQAAGLVTHFAENGISCPKCNFQFSLSRGGCMHFTCSQCKFEFCSGCGKEFKMGARCTVGPYCAKLGLHAHHPRNCLFYLRDKEPENLQKLLDDHGVPYDTVINQEYDGSEVAASTLVKKCCVLLQKETPLGFVDDICGNLIEQAFAGLCKQHYLEYLAKIIKEHRLDPLMIFEGWEMIAELRRMDLPIPEREPGESEGRFYSRCAEVIRERLPLE